MAAYVFGQDISFQFFPKDDEGDPVTPSADSPSIWIYSDRPDRDTVKNETGATSSVVGSEITSWTPSGNSREFTIPAISDPDTSSGTYSDTYYAGIKYTLETSGQQQINIVAFIVSRTVGYDVELDVPAADIEKYFPQIDAYVTEVQQDSFVTEAIEEIRATLRDSGFDWAKIRRPDRLRLVVIHKVLSRVALSQYAGGDDGFLTMYEQSKLTADSMLSSVKLEYDSTGDQQTDSERSKGNFYRVIR